MKTGACPECESREIYVIEEVATPYWRSSNSVDPLALTAAYGAYGPNMKNARIHAGIEAYVCAKCARTQLYAKDLAVLERLANAGAGVKKVKR